MSKSLFSPQPAPKVAEALARFLQLEPVELWPLLIALGERQAAERYRRWAELVGDAAHRAELLACAEREEDVALRVEDLHSDADVIQQGIEQRHPDFAERGREFFESGPLEEQFRMQAQAERLGAATWKSCARRHADASARDIYLGCAAMDEQNAESLEAMAAAMAAVA